MSSPKSSRPSSTTTTSSSSSELVIKNASSSELTSLNTDGAAFRFTYFGGLLSGTAFTRFIADVGSESDQFSKFFFFLPFRGRPLSLASSSSSRAAATFENFFCFSSLSRFRRIFSLTDVPKPFFSVDCKSMFSNSLVDFFCSFFLPLFFGFLSFPARASSFEEEDVAPGCVDPSIFRLFCCGLERHGMETKSSSSSSSSSSGVTEDEGLPNCTLATFRKRGDEDMLSRARESQIFDATDYKLKRRFE